MRNSFFKVQLSQRMGSGLSAHLLRFLLVGMLFVPLMTNSLSAQKKCGCDPAKTLDQYIKESNVIVLGTCNNIITNPIKGGLNVSFEVDSSWVRAIEPNATFHTNASNQCGAVFEVGKRYFVFGKKRHQTVETTVCLPNQLFSEDGEAMLSKLGTGFSPGRPELAQQMNLLILGLGVGGVLLVAFVVLRKRLFAKKGTSVSGK